jgi:hypothetical protein
MVGFPGVRFVQLYCAFAFGLSFFLSCVEDGGVAKNLLHALGFNLPIGGELDCVRTRYNM